MTLRDEGAYAGLVVELGMPYEKGFRFLLQQNKVLLGRASRSSAPDIAFNCMMVSRRHCYVENKEGTWTIAELGSKHGTLLNGKPLVPGTLTPLQHGDKIGLASNLVLLRFSFSPEDEATFDFTNTQVLKLDPAFAKVPLCIDAARQSLRIRNAEIYLSLKEWRLLELLYRHRNHLVSYEEIRQQVWDERSWGAEGSPDVGTDELNILIYRLRRKLGDQSGRLVTRRGQGCILEL